MGLFRKHSESFLDCRHPSVEEVPKGNPDPSNYSIIKSHETKNTLLVMIQYPDCTNYEGIKILLFLDCALKDLIKQKVIDPHFSSNKRYKHPFARFEPTNFGWLCGKRMQLYTEAALSGMVKELGEE